MKTKPRVDIWGGNGSGEPTKRLVARVFPTLAAAEDFFDRTVTVYQIRCNRGERTEGGWVPASYVIRLVEVGGRPVEVRKELRKALVFPVR